MEYPAIPHKVVWDQKKSTFVLFAHRQLSREEQIFYAEQAVRLHPRRFKKGKTYEIPLFSLIGEQS